MDVNGVKESKKGQVLFATAHGVFKTVIGENPVVHALGSGTFVVNGLPFNRTARNGSMKPKIVGMAQIHGFTVRCRAANVGVWTIRNAAKGAGGAEFSTEFVPVKAPVDHLMSIWTDGDAVL